MGKAHVLIADDSRTLVHAFSLRFQRAGYNVSHAYDGIQALQHTLEEEPDLLLLDYQMPKLTGIDVVRTLRNKGCKIPVILMTGHNSDKLHTQSLKLGSDDYLTLPIAFEVLLAHVETRLESKRDEPSVKYTTILRFADVELNIQEHSAYRNARALELTPKEYQLLGLFLRHPHHVLKRDHILDQIWGNDFEGESNVVDVYVKALRQKLEADSEERLIQTVRGVGYVLRQQEAAREGRSGAMTANRQNREPNAGA